MGPSTCSRPCTPRASLSWARQYSYALLRKNVTMNVVMVACCCQKVCDTGGAQRASPSRRACVGVLAQESSSSLACGVGLGFEFGLRSGLAEERPCGRLWGRGAAAGHHLLEISLDQVGCQARDGERDEWRQLRTSHEESQAEVDEHDV